jgi:hypothetical protein
MIIGLGLSLDQSRQINHLLTGRSFGEGQVPCPPVSQPLSERPLRAVTESVTGIVTERGI